MFNVKYFKELIAERIKLSIKTQDEWDYAIDLVNNKMIDLICSNIDAAIDYILNDCTGDEFAWLSEFFDEVIEKTLSQKYIDALRVVTKKYPIETKKYNIISFIDDAQYRLNYLLNPKE